MITRKKRMCQGPAVRKTPCGISTRFYCTHFRLGSGSKGISLPGIGPPRSPASSVGMRRGRTSRRCQSWCSRSWGSCRNPEKIEKVLLTVTNYKKEAFLSAPPDRRSPLDKSRLRRCFRTAPGRSAPQGSRSCSCWSCGRSTPNAGKREKKTIEIVKMQ